nr:serine/threonine protein phosphatase 2a 57 kda regulatory subunit b' iota isoform [Quercus suber]
MLKQIWSKLPRKSSKSSNDSSAESNRYSNSPRATSQSQSNGGGGGGGGKRTAVFPASVVAGIEPLVPFKDVPNSEKMNLFVSKVSLCCVTFDFTDSSKNSVEKDVKRRTLIELVDFVASASASSGSCSIRFTEPAILALCRMCAANLFRVFPPSFRSNCSGGGGDGGGDSDNNECDGEPMFDPAWPHLNLVYDLLLKFITSSCVDAKFIEKEPKLTSTVIRGLLKFWPVTNSQKEMMFLGEIEEILDAINMVEFQKIMVPLFLRIGCCINSFHFQVAERALFFWNNDNIVNLIAHNRQVILPIVFPAFERNVQSHWNPAVLNLSLNVRKMFMEMDEVLFQSCHAHFEEEEAKLSLAAEKRKEAWERLENAASLQPITGNTAVLVTPLSTSITC